MSVRCMFICLVSNLTQKSNANNPILWIGSSCVAGAEERAAPSDPRSEDHRRHSQDHVPHRVRRVSRLLLLPLQKLHQCTRVTLSGSDILLSVTWQVHIKPKHMVDLFSVLIFLNGNEFKKFLQKFAIRGSSLKHCTYLEDTAYFVYVLFLGTKRSVIFTHPKPLSNNLDLDEENEFIGKLNQTIPT